MTLPTEIIKEFEQALEAEAQAWEQAIVEELNKEEQVSESRIQLRLVEPEEKCV